MRLAAALILIPASLAIPYTPFPMQNACWTVLSVSTTGYGPMGYTATLLSGDTVIGGVKYAKSVTKYSGYHFYDEMKVRLHP
jgi:hypothetical protein